MIEIKAIGGYDEVGKNMTAIRIDDEVIICDMGLDVEKYVDFSDDEEVLENSKENLLEAGVIPDPQQLGEWSSMVKAIIPTHGHLDHIGALPFLASQFNSPIIGTPFTVEVLKSEIRNEKINLKNEIKELNPNSKIRISENIEVEFIHMTHSIPQTVSLAIHTHYGTLIYANDFKFDNFPVLGKKPNFKRLREVGEKNVLALIADTIYANEERKMPSESVAKQMLKDVIEGTNSEGKGMVITTFSSHLARLKSIIEFGRKLNREIIFLGRSLSKYIQAGEKSGVWEPPNDVNLVKYRTKVEKKLKEVMRKGKENYLLVVTGNQGEPKSILPRMVRGETPFKFSQDDFVIFSSKIIPTQKIINNREALEEELRNLNTRIFKDLHASGHAGKEDLKDMIKLTHPQNIIPVHGPNDMKKGFRELGEEMNYSDKQIHLLNNGKKLKIPDEN